MSDIKQKILDDLKMTGFITELEIASMLFRNCWSVYSNTNYEDLDKQSSREIDIVSIHMPNGQDENIHLELYLVIEVKKATKRPWIIFTSQKRGSETPGWRMQHVLRNHRLYNLSEPPGDTILDSDHLSLNHPRKRFQRIGRSYHEAFKNPDEPSKIFEAVISACKACKYFQSTLDPGKEISDLKFNPSEPVTCFLFVPVVVLEGELYEVYLKNNGETAIEQVPDWLSLDVNYSSPNYGSDPFERNIDFFVDIVRKEKFEQYQETLKDWINEVFNKFKTDILRQKTRT